MAIGKRAFDFAAPKIPQCDPMADDCALLQSCAAAGSIEVVQALIPGSDPRAGKSAALRAAVAAKDHAMVALLAPHSDVDAKDSEAMKRAVKDAELEVLQALIPHADPAKAAKIIKAEGFEDEAEAMLLGLLAPSPSRPKF